MATAGDIQVLKQVLGSPVVFAVPDFQRNYSWGQKQIEDLLSDLEEARESNDQHFIGSLITMKDPEVKDRTLVIDGQQRLTTIFMLVALLRDAVAKLESHELEIPQGPTINVLENLGNFLFAMSNDGSFKVYQKFVAHPMISEMFSASIIANPIGIRPPLLKKKYSKPLRDGHAQLEAWIKKEVSKLATNDQKLAFCLDVLGTLEQKVTLLQISTESIPEAFDIFMSLNSTGLPLGPSDLVKTLLFRVLTSGLDNHQREARTKELTGIWQEVLENLSKGDTDQFLRHYLLATQRGKVQKKKIFPIFEQMIKAVPDELTAVEHAQNILDTILDASMVYEEILTSQSLESSAGKLALETLYELGASYRVLVLSALDPSTGLSTEDAEKLVLSTEAFTMRWNLTGRNAQELETLFQGFANDLRESKKSPAEVIEAMSAENPSDNTVQSTFEEQINSSSTVKLILSRIERELIGDDTEIKHQSLHIDWIAPQNPTDSWIETLFPEDNEDMTLEYEATVEQWGNKVILKKPVPVPAKAASFLEKAKGNADFLGYETSPFQTTRDIAKLSGWNRKEIKNRNKLIGEAVNRIWNL
jgi:hypothetical protein